MYINTHIVCQMFTLVLVASRFVWFVLYYQAHFTSKFQPTLEFGNKTYLICFMLSVCLGLFPKQNVYLLRKRNICKHRDTFAHIIFSIGLFILNHIV